MSPVFRSLFRPQCRPSEVRTLTFLALAFLLLHPLGAAAPAGAQEVDRTAPSEVFVDTVEVDVVNLEVIVTGADGDPVRGLGKDDFVVLEDGEPVELTNFYAVESARRVLPPEEAPVDRPVLVELPQDQVLNLAVVLDNDNLSPQNRQKAIEQIRYELDRVLRPGDRVMVAVLAGVPRVALLFTSDLDAVDAALQRLARKAAGNVALEAQRRNIYDLLSRAAAGNLGYGPEVETTDFTPEQREQPIDTAHNIKALIEAYANQADRRMRASFAAVDALVSTLSGLPSRKAVLLVSEGLSTNPALEMYEAFVDVFGPTAMQAGVSSPGIESRRFDLTDLMDRVARNAAAHRVTFYTLDAFGARGLQSAEAGEARRVTVSVDLAQQETLVRLAATTGGTAMLNASNVEKLVGRMASDYSDYYSLGYVGRHGRDGLFHELEVRVPTAEGARVRHTEGYRAHTVDQEMEDRALAALMLDVAPNPLGVRIELGKQQAETRDRYLVPVLVKVPVSKLTLVPTRNVHRGKVSVYVALRDEHGGLSQPQHFEVPVEIPNEQLLNALSREVGYGVNLRLRGGPSKLAVAVRDDVAAVESTVNLNISVGGANGG